MNNKEKYIYIVSDTEEKKIIKQIKAHNCNGKLEKILLKLFCKLYDTNHVAIDIYPESAIADPQADGYPF